MSENWKYQASVKVGDVMHNVRGEDSQEFEKNLLEFPVAAAAQFQANVAGGQSLGQIVQPDPTQPIAHPSQQQPAQPPAWAQQQPTNVVPLQQQAGETCTNPDGKSPAACGMALQAAETRTGKKQLKCPQYRYSSGQGGNGHRVVWL